MLRKLTRLRSYEIYCFVVQVGPIFSQRSTFDLFMERSTLSNPKGIILFLGFGEFSKCLFFLEWDEGLSAFLPESLKIIFKLYRDEFTTKSELLPFESKIILINRSMGN